MIKAVIFDVGGVLVRTENPSCRLALEAKHNLSAGEAEYLVFNSEMGRKAQHGEITTAELWAWLADHLSLDADQLADFQAQFFAGDQLDRGMVEFVHKLQHIYQTAIISNAADNLLENITDIYPMASAFGLIVGSAYEGIMKPDPTIFMRTLERLDRQPNEAVFIDDFLHNIEAARSLGMEAIHFQPSTDLPQELADLGVVV